jgi:MinD superfamily P-loop ATPase
VPVIDESRCTACGACVRFCQYKALVRLGKLVMVFPELCHGCGGCAKLCPTQAITEQPREIGAVESGATGPIGFVHGLLNIGEAMSPPLIRQVLTHATDEAHNVIDAPPGTSCPVINAIRDADFVALVTEPTPFGLNDLGLALEMVRALGLRHGVIINRAEGGNDDARRFCEERGATVLGQIPDDRRIAEAYSRGAMILRAVPGIREYFELVWQTIYRQVHA